LPAIGDRKVGHITTDVCIIWDPTILCAKKGVTTYNYAICYSKLPQQLGLKTVQRLKALDLEKHHKSFSAFLIRTPFLEIVYNHIFGERFCKTKSK